MAYLGRFFGVLGFSMGFGLICGLVMTAILGPGLFPDQTYAETLRVGIKGGLIFGGMWGLGLAIVGCFMLGHQRGEVRRGLDSEAGRETGTESPESKK